MKPEINEIIKSLNDIIIEKNTHISDDTPFNLQYSSDQIVKKSTIIDNYTQIIMFN